MVAIRREQKEEYLTAPDVVGEIAVLADCLPELKTRSAVLLLFSVCTTMVYWMLLYDQCLASCLFWRSLL